ncbi:MAG: amidohydrolase family protein, partial [Pseudomonadota bacterium]|nr:amidohydrolase family protein [Pseudomonadota bacterium]
IDTHLGPIVDAFPKLKVVFEHITTADAASFVAGASEFVGATITPQHLLLNRNDLLVGGVRPHNYCLPVLKRNTHQKALRDMVASGNKKFFLGTDSAPHAKHKKENACGCAGCYSAWSAIELYAEVFEQLGAIDKLEGFASHYGADFYGLPRNTTTMTLVKESWTVPEQVTLADGTDMVPFYAGQMLQWKLEKAFQAEFLLSLSVYVPCGVHPLGHKHSLTLTPQIYQVPYLPLRSRVFNLTHLRCLKMPYQKMALI